MHKAYNMQYELRTSLLLLFPAEGFNLNVDLIQRRFLEDSFLLGCLCWTFEFVESRTCQTVHFRLGLLLLDWYLIPLELSLCQYVGFVKSQFLIWLGGGLEQFTCHQQKVVQFLLLFLLAASSHTKHSPAIFYHWQQQTQCSPGVWSIMPLNISGVGHQRHLCHMHKDHQT